MIPSVDVVIVGLHDSVSIILYLTITVRHYTLGTTLHCTILASFPVEKRWMKVDVLYVCCVFCVLSRAADGSHGW